jgi:ATP-dependent RNA helicase RhlB
MRLAEKLKSYDITTGLLTGDVDQIRRIKTLEAFRTGKTRVLVATDVAARGLHIEGISHVVNYNLPMNAEDYVHRIGRTGRAGASGISVSFACEDDAPQIPVIEQFLGRKLEAVYPNDAWLTALPPPHHEVHRYARPADAKRPQGGRSRKNARNRPRNGHSRTSH